MAKVRDRYSLANAWTFWLSALAFIFFTGLLAEVTAFIYRRLNRTGVERYSAIKAPYNAIMTNIGCVQFVLAIFLINFTILFRKQVNFTEKRDTGFVKEDWFSLHDEGPAQKL